MKLQYSIIIPVYNRPEELTELLESLSVQSYDQDFEVLVIEDGSNRPAEDVVRNFQRSLTISYFTKENSGPGLSRNYGMARAKGNYFLILDSDVILPPDYLKEVDQRLETAYTDFFGGPDAAHESFSPLQKAINFSMTSLFTTGGLRGKKQTKDFQPRSFNMGLSKKAFDATGGFSEQHFGEDIDLTFRLWEQGFQSQFVESAYVYHKRRSTVTSFFKQVFNFGAARPVLNTLYPSTSKLTYWFPTLFFIGMLAAIVFLVLGWNAPIVAITVYLVLIFVDAFTKEKSLIIGLLSVLTTFIQFIGYGLGFLRSMFRIKIKGQTPEAAFPRMFR